MLSFMLAAAISLVMLAGNAGAQGLSDVRAGNVAFKDGDLEKAVELYSNAIESGNLNQDALSITLNNRGVVQGEIGNFDVAIADYLKALELRPGDATTQKNLRVAHVRRGQVRKSSGDQNAALSDYSEAIAAQPDHYLAYLYRAQLYVERGDLELALIDLERATEFEPGDPKAQEALAQVERDLTLARAPVSTKTETASAEPRPSNAAIADATPRAGPVEPPPASNIDTTIATAPAIPTAPEPSVATAPRPAPQAASPTVDFAGTEGVKMRTNSAVNYRGGPSNQDPRIGTVDAGAIVTVVGDTLGWKHIILPNGDRGFIYKRWLVPVGD